MTPEHAPSVKTNFDHALAIKAVGRYIDIEEGPHDWKLLERGTYIPVAEWDSDTKGESVDVWIVIAVRGNGDRLAMHIVGDELLSVMLVRKGVTSVKLQPPFEEPDPVTQNSISQFVTALAAILFAATGTYAEARTGVIGGSMSGGGTVKVGQSAIIPKPWDQEEGGDDLR